MENTTNLQIIEDVRQSAEYGEYTKRIGWKTIQVTSPKSQNQIFLRKLGPVSVVKIQRVYLPLPWEEIEEVLKENRVMMCKLEPLRFGPEFTIHDLRNRGWKLDKWPLIGAKTLRISLSPSLSSIMSGFKKDARYCIRQVTNLNPQITKNNFDKFFEIWREANRIKRLWTPKKKDYQSLVDSFGKKCFCVMVNDLAGCLVLMHERMAYYFYSGALPEGKVRNLPYLVAWEAMKEAKIRGCLVWDWEGIYDTRWPNKGWRGFSHFKKSFGGEEVQFPGSFNRWMWPYRKGF